jgi:hypothetical protein
MDISKETGSRANPGLDREDTEQFLNLGGQLFQALRVGRDIGIS